MARGGVSDVFLRVKWPGCRFSPFLRAETARVSFQPFFKGWNGQGVVSAFFKGWNGVSFQTCFQGENEHWQNKESLDLHVFALKTRTECKPDQNIVARNAIFFALKTHTK